MMTISQSCCGVMDKTTGMQENHEENSLEREEDDEENSRKWEK